MPDWYKKEITEVLKELNVDAVKGLSDVEAVQRLAECGPNELQVDGRISAWVISPPAPQNRASR